ncbi:MAG: hypothetical protein ACLF0G_10260 [Candidatus Brocadiia bacterium]
MGKSLLNWLLGIDRGEIAEGSGVRLKFANPWPTWVILVFAVAAVALVFALYKREKGTATRRRKLALATVRCLVVALVVLVLFKPILAVDKSELKQAYVVVLLDDSASMGVTDRYVDPEVQRGLAQVAGLAGGETTELSREQSVQLNERTRAELVNRALANPDIHLLSRLEDRCKLLVVTFADEVRGVEPGAWRPERPGHVPRLVKPSGDRTRITKALRHYADNLRGHRIAAMVVVSDGQTEEADPGEQASQLGILHGQPFPVFTVGVGAAESKDIKIVNILAPEAAKKDDRVTLNVVIASRGYEGGEQVGLKLFRDGQLMHTEPVSLRGDAKPQKVPLPYRPESTGTFRFRASIPARPEELSSENNAAEHTLTVKESKAKVLFVSGQPSYFYRFLKNALLVDQSIQLSCILQSADPDFHQEGNVRITHYPSTRSELFEYDVVVFSDVDPGSFTPEQLAALEAFVRQFGGGFILVAGPFYPVAVWSGTPIEELLPVRLGRMATPGDPLASQTLTEEFRPRLSLQGRNHGIAQLARTVEESQEVWERFPGCYWYQPVAGPTPDAIVLAEHPYDQGQQGPAPLIALGPHKGEGRTLFCALDGTWRWRFGVGDVYFNRFWVQAILYVGTERILGGSRRVRVDIDKRPYALGERVHVRALCFDEAFQASQADALEARVEMQGGASRTVGLKPSGEMDGVFEGSFEATQPGRGTVVVSAGAEQAAADFEVRLLETEFEDPTMDAASLREVAEATRGDFFRLHEIGELNDRVEAASQRITSEVQDEVFDAPLVVALFLGAICTEWWFRKRGMLA